MSKISIVIPTFNEEKYIEACLVSLDKQTLPRESYEVIIVDGNSLDSTKEIAKDYADRIIEHKSEGVGGARNDGVMVSKGEIIATTDADTILPRDWLERILKHFENRNVVGVSGPSLPIENGFKSSIAFKWMGFNQKLNNIFGMQGMNGFNSAFRKKDFFAVGGYRGIPYCDDSEIMFRLRNVGKIIYDPDLSVAVSTRRFEQDGYLKTLSLWSIGIIRLMFNLNLNDVPYFRVHKPWAYPHSFEKHLENCKVCKKYYVM